MSRVLLVRLVEWRCYSVLYRAVDGGQAGIK